jgi:antitoxin component YwqK of YwqJK toxin-antitoxin module
MRLILYFFIFFIINKTSFSQENIIKNDSVNIEKTWIENIDSLYPINGIKNGVVVYQTINDTLEGEFKVYDDKETLRFKTNVFDGKKEGAAYSYTYKGQLEEIRSYSNDMAISRIFIDHRGRIYRIANYNFKELKHGEEVSFFKNETVWIKRIWKNGKLVKYTYFYRNGNIKSIYFQDEDEKLIRMEYYKRNGKLKEVIE